MGWQTGLEREPCKAKRFYGVIAIATAVGAAQNPRGGRFWIARRGCDSHAARRMVAGARTAKAQTQATSVTMSSTRNRTGGEQARSLS